MSRFNRVNDPLQDAIESDNEEIFVWMLSTGHRQCSLDGVGEKNKLNLLQRAAKHGALKILKWLLGPGGLKIEETAYEKTSLDAEEEKAQQALRALQAPKDRKILPEEKEFILQEETDSEIEEYLSDSDEKGSDISEDNDPPLMWAIIEDNLEVVQWLVRSQLEGGYGLTLRSDFLRIVLDGRSVRHPSAEHRTLKWIFTPKEKGGYGFSPSLFKLEQHRSFIFCAAEQDRIEILKWLASAPPQGLGLLMNVYDLKRQSLMQKAASGPCQLFVFQGVLAEIAAKKGIEKALVWGKANREYSDSLKPPFKKFCEEAFEKLINECDSGKNVLLEALAKQSIKLGGHKSLTFLIELCFKSGNYELAYWILMDVQETYHSEKSQKKLEKVREYLADMISLGYLSIDAAPDGEVHFLNVKDSASPDDLRQRAVELFRYIGITSSEKDTWETPLRKTANRWMRGNDDMSSESGDLSWTMMTGACEAFLDYYRQVESHERPCDQDFLNQLEQVVAQTKKYQNDFVQEDNPSCNY